MWLFRETHQQINANVFRNLLFFFLYWSILALALNILRQRRFTNAEFFSLFEGFVIWLNEWFRNIKKLQSKRQQCQTVNQGHALSMKKRTHLHKMDGNGLYALKRWGGNFSHMLQNGCYAICFWSMQFNVNKRNGLNQYTCTSKYDKL